MNDNLTALRFITRCLNNKNPVQASSLLDEIQSGDVPWESVAYLANNHLLTPALWVALQNKNLTSELPEDFREYLNELHHLSKQRNDKLRGQLLETIGYLNTLNITPILLKGAVHLVSDIYPDNGVRMMSDLDILVAQNEVEPTQEALINLGYQKNTDCEVDYPPDHHHCAPLFRPGDYASLEIHRQLLDKRYSHILSAETAIDASVPLIVDGHSMRVLNPSHRVLHNILHSQLMDQHYANGMIPLRSLYEVVTENAVSKNNIDWPMLIQLMDEHNKSKILQTYLYQTHRLFGIPLPSGIQKTIYSQLYYLRCYTQLGWGWVDTCGIRLGAFSAENIHHIYGCEESWMRINQARLRHVLRRFTN